MDGPLGHDTSNAEPAFPPDDMVRDIPEDLRESVASAVLPPSVPSPDLLPFGSHEPRDFEHDCLVVVDQVDGVRDVRLYGVPGQAQHGLDLVGRDDSGNSVAYQIKRHEEFSASDLEASVEKFAKGRRPFRPKRFVVCASCVVDRTEVLEVLDRLREENDFEIELYDARRLSSLLTNRYDIVRRLFGNEWARHFVGHEPVQPPEQTPADLLSASLLRGPIKALGLQPVVDEANEKEDADPGTAARLFNQAAARLTQTGFGGLARAMRHREAELLVKAGEGQAAAALLCDLTWERFDEGSAHRDHESLARLRALANERDLPQVRAIVCAIEAIDRWYSDPKEMIDAVGEAISQLPDESPLGDEVHLWFAETAIAIHRPQLVLTFADALANRIERRHASAGVDELAIRYQICLAEATENWDDLLRSARRGELDRRLASLVFARHGRAAAWRGQPLDADDSYREAVDPACMADIPRDAAQQMIARWRVFASYGAPSEELVALPQLAAAVEASGSGSILERRHDPYDMGMNARARHDLPEALRWFRVSLRDATTAGWLEQELDTCTALSELLCEAGEVELGVIAAIRAGAREIVGRVMPLGRFMAVASQLQAAAPWQRALALEGLALQGDLVPDEAVDALVDQALNDTSGVPQSPMGPQVWVNAWKVVAALADRLDPRAAERALTLLGPQIQREANQYRYNDDEHIAVVTKIFVNQADWRPRAAEHLLAVIEQQGHFAEQMLDIGWPAISADAARFIPRLSELADHGNDVAIRLLLQLDHTHPKILDAARRAFDQEISQPPPPPGVYTFGTSLPRSAVLARALPESERCTMAMHAIQIAEDGTRPETNRVDGLRALLAVADTLPMEHRAELTERCLVLARQGVANSPLDEMLLGGRHPLSTFRFDLEADALSPTAVHAAAVLADRADQRRDVEQLAISMLVGGSERAAYEGAHALAQLPADEVSADVRVLARLPSALVRQFAAIAWTRAPGEAPEVGALLAADPDVTVRRALASQVGRIAQEEPERQHVRDTLSNDPCWSVRSLVR
jgi:hypothetical protein